MMRLHVAYETTPGPWGGSNSFIRALVKDLRTRPVRLVAAPEGADVVLLNGAYGGPGRLTDLRTVANLKRWGRVSTLSRLLRGAVKPPKVVLRLDGLRSDYAGVDTPMDAAQLALLPLADRVVFQSRYSLDAFARAGYAGGRHDIVPNGVDLEVFHARGRARWDGVRPLRVLASSWSANPAKGHETIAAFSALPGVETTFIGRWAPGVDARNVRIQPPLAHDELAARYREADAFLFPARSEACPNAVLEALASGLPVWYAASGGTRELAEGYGVELTGDHAADLARMRDGHASLQDAVLRDAGRWSVARAGSAYLDVFQEVLDGTSAEAAR